jgi:hypothetical protein
MPASRTGSALNPAAFRFKAMQMQYWQQGPNERRRWLMKLRQDTIAQCGTGVLERPVEGSVSTFLKSNRDSNKF